MEAADEEEIPPEFECSICMKLLLGPVTVSCGHTFCRTCLEKSLGYRGSCAVCRAPIAAGQGVNVLVKNIVAERFPVALARRLQEVHEELLENERLAEQERQRDTFAGSPVEQTTAGTDRGQVLPLVEGLDHNGTAIMPHSSTKVKLAYALPLVEYVLQGGRRIGFVDLQSTGSFDDSARPLGVCFEVESVSRNGGNESLVLTGRGKYRFWVIEEPQLHENGFYLGRCEAFFDEALPTSELAAAQETQEAQARENEADDAGQPWKCPELARSTAQLLEGQLVNVGQSGRRVFLETFGDIPAPAPPSQPSTSANLEKFSFFTFGSLITDAAERRRWLTSTSTRARLEHCHERLEIAGNRPLLNLPGAGSWMSPGSSAFTSLALLIAIVALCLAKASGLLDMGFNRGGGWRRHEETINEAFAFGQLLR